jgi:hypothetical protein
MSGGRGSRPLARGQRADRCDKLVRLREVEERSEVSLDEWPNVGAWMERLEGRESYEAAV